MTEQRTNCGVTVTFGDGLFPDPCTYTMNAVLDYKRGFVFLSGYDCDYGRFKLAFDNGKIPEISACGFRAANDDIIFVRGFAPQDHPSITCIGLRVSIDHDKCSEVWF